MTERVRGDRRVRSHTMQKDAAAKERRGTDQANEDGRDGRGEGREPMHADAAAELSPASLPSSGMGKLLFKWNGVPVPVTFI